MERRERVLCKVYTVGWVDLNDFRLFFEFYANPVRNPSTNFPPQESTPNFVEKVLFLKGAVSQDFLPFFYFMNSSHLGP